MKKVGVSDCCGKEVETKICLILLFPYAVKDFCKSCGQPCKQVEKFEPKNNESQD
jgi:hypothetical protein